MSAVDEKLSPGHDDLPGNDGRGTKRNRMSADDEDDDDDKPGRERRKIEIKFIQDKSRRHITFSKRKAGIMKKVRVSLALPIPPILYSPACANPISRPMSFPSSPELKSCFWSSRKPVSSIPSLPLSSSPS